LSDQAPFSGRLIHGLRQGELSSLNRPAARTWNDETEARYMEQVRERAQQMARDILAQALSEADQLRKRAREEGLAKAREEIQARAKAESDKVSDFLGRLQSALESEKKRAFDAHKQALFQILKLAFEKTLGVMLAEERENVLHSLFEEAASQLQTTTCITVKVCNQDLELTKALIEKTRQARPDLPELRVCPCADLEMGGVRIESGDGLVDNSVASRFEQVRAILDGYRENS
jgi:flagellar assembly protein FliH